MGFKQHILKWKNPRGGWKLRLEQWVRKNVLMTQEEDKAWEERDGRSSEQTKADEEV
jgi:hypothetical protein